jgi:hypothetical protein
MGGAQQQNSPCECFPTALLARFRRNLHAKRWLTRFSSTTRILCPIVLFVLLDSFAAGLGCGFRRWRERRCSRRSQLLFERRWLVERRVSSSPRKTCFSFGKSKSNDGLSCPCLVSCVLSERKVVLKVTNSLVKVVHLELQIANLLMYLSHALERFFSVSCGLSLLCGHDK